ncbi:MAG: hypothetical protein JKY54_09950 [Flavobacteriales bacterium]|nr:hypothetical protein [Flavobacteriales bacterium]
MTKRTQMIAVLSIAIGVLGCGSISEGPWDKEAESQIEYEIYLASLEGFELFLKGFEGLAHPNAEIPDSLAVNFIASALKDEYKFQYSEGFSYSYGKLMYRNDLFAAVSFFVEGDDGTNLLDAKFLATFNLEHGQLLDVAMIGDASDYEGHTSIGYNTYVSLTSTFAENDEEQIAIIISCQESTRYYNYNESYLEEGENPGQEHTEDKIYSMILGADGHFKNVEE